MKICSLCNESKKIECFTTKSGNVKSRCKECLARLQKEWNEKNPEKVKETKRKKYIKYKEKITIKNKEWVEKNREKSNEIKKNYKIRHKEKYQAQQREYQLKRYYEENKQCASVRLHNRKIRKGEIMRPTICSRCKAEGYIEGHHFDYNKPLEVVWLCKKCHAAEHKKLKEQ